MRPLKHHLARPRDRLRRLMETDPRDLSRAGRVVVHQVRLWGVFWRLFRRGHVAIIAGHLTFKTLLSLIPMVVIVLLMVSFFAPGPELSGKVQESLFNMLNIDQIDIMVDNELVDLQDKIDGMVETARQRVGAAAAVGIVFLFGIAFSVLSTIEGVVNRIWEVEVKRSWWRKFLLFWMLLTLGPPAIAAAVYGSMRLGQMASVLPGWAAVIGSHALELAAVWCVFFAIYKLMPRVPVRPTAALAGAIVAGTLWHAVAKEAFIFYIHHTAGYGRLYGSLAVIPIFFLWIYVTWIVILFGCTLAYVVQDLKELARAEHTGDEGDGGRFLAADFVALMALATCARRFREGAGPTPMDRLVDATGVGPEDLAEVLGRLEAAGLLARAPRPDDDAPLDEAEMAYLPARDPAGITVAAVLKAAESALPVPVDSQYVPLGRAVRAAYERVREASSGSGDRTTVADLASAADGPKKG